MGEKIVKVLNILYNRLDLNMARILYLVPLTSHTHIHTHTHARVPGHVRSQTCAGIRSSLLASEILLYPLRSLKGRHTGLETCLDSYVRERTFELRRFTRSIICERVFASPVPGPSRGVFFSRRREVESCRSKCGKRSALLADLCDGSPYCIGRKEQIRLTRISRRARFFLFVVAKNSTVFDECIFHRAYCYVLYYRKRAARLLPDG